MKVIEEFIQEALELYRKQQSTKVDYSRYLYIPVLSGFAAMMANKEEDGGNAPSAVYKRYKLSEEKTFASFFHPDKVRCSLASLRMARHLSKDGKHTNVHAPMHLLLR